MIRKTGWNPSHFNGEMQFACLNCLEKRNANENRFFDSGIGGITVLHDTLKALLMRIIFITQIHPMFHMDRNRRMKLKSTF
jgi:hypothetical protein